MYMRICFNDERDALMILDAAGKIPDQINESEIKWSEMIKSGELSRNMYKLKLRQAMSLSEKIEISLSRIREWHDAFDGNVAVSYSGGKDSEVLLWLVRMLYPDTPAVFCNTGLEYPEIVRHVRNHDNVITIKPIMHFKKVIETYGYPLISKKVGRGISVLRNPTSQNQNVRRLYNEGINRFGQPVNGFKVPSRWKFLVNAPFNTSDKCCSIMKKEPMNRFEKETGMVQFVGTLATDSKTREKTYLRYGCNGYDMKTPRSTPLGFWTEQDILQCIKKNNIQYASVYGDISIDRNTGRLHTTGTRRTGCVFCAFGLQMDESPNRFQLMKDTHPKLWDYCMTKLNMGMVLKYIRDYCPDRNVIDKFNPTPIKSPEQMEMFS